MKFNAILVLLLVAAGEVQVVSHAQEAPSEFLQATERAMTTRYRRVQVVADALLREGKLDEAVQAYVSNVPADKMTPPDHFLLGTTLHGLAPELSVKFLELTFQAMPEDPHVNLEWAMTLHRQGRHAEAVLCYRKSLPALPGHFLPNVLLADCLVRTGEYEAALKHWEAARHRQNHRAIDFAAFSIYGRTSPHLRHRDLVAAVKAGQVERLDELIFLAANWDRDWWNANPNSTFLLRDLELGKELLGADDARYKELELFATSYVQRPLDKEWLKKELESQNLILGEDCRLPKSSLVTDRLLAVAIEQGLAEQPALLKRFEAEILERAKGEGTSAATAQGTLAALVMGTEDPGGRRLAEIDAGGWEKHHDERAAASLLENKAGRKELTLASPLMEKGLKDFPESQLIADLARRMARDEKVPPLEHIVRAIKAEFRHLSVADKSVKDSTRLSVLFDQLKKEIGAR